MQSGHGARMEPPALRSPAILPGGLLGAHLGVGGGDPGQPTHAGIPHQIPPGLRSAQRPLHGLH